MSPSSPRSFLPPTDEEAGESGGSVDERGGRSGDLVEEEVDSTIVAQREGGKLGGRHRHRCSPLRRRASGSGRGAPPPPARSFMPSVAEEWRRPSSNLPWKMSWHGGLDARRGAEPVRMATTERRIGQEEQSGNFTYWRNVVILSHCATW